MNSDTSRTIQDMRSILLLISVVVISLLCLPAEADWICEVEIRKDGTSIVTCYNGRYGTNEASRLWFNAIAPKATDNDTLNVTVTLGDVTFSDAVEAIERVVQPWRGRITLNMTSVRGDGSCITLTTRARNGADVRILRTTPQGSLGRSLRRSDGADRVSP